MTIIRKLYLLGFAIYLFSFLLPATLVYDMPWYGFMTAYLAFGLLFDPTELIPYYLIVSANVANFSTLLAFILHFRLSFRKLLPLQLIAFISAACLAVAGLFQETDLGPLLIGYWNWLFGIFFMLVVMACSLRKGKKA